MLEGISEIVEFTAIEEIFWHVVLQPQDLWDLHLDAHGAADVAEEVVFGGVDELGLLDGPVVEPQHDVVVVGRRVEVGPRHRHRLVRVVRKHRQRTRRVEPNAPDRVRINVVLRNRPVH